jgi:polysaccharide deacetylase 2 family uncharacterized protein YibQ
MPPKRSPRNKKGRSGRLHSFTTGWLRVLLASLPAIIFVVVGLVVLLRSTAPTPPDTLVQIPPAVKPAPPASHPSLLSGPSPAPPAGAVAEEQHPAVVAVTDVNAPVSPMMRGPGKPRLAIIMDDLGRDLGSARTLLGIDLPVTFAILPGEVHAARVARLAHQQGREVLIHIPMEPRSYPVVDPGDDALLVEQSPEEHRRRFQIFLQQVPHASGANNHMGSRFTEHAEGLATIFAEMKQAGLFFVDSVTSSKSVALTGARQAGLRAIGRDVFLDNVQDVERIAVEIRKLVALAEKHGQAVGICHPYPQTMEALRREAAFLRERVEVVAVSRLLL